MIRFYLSVTFFMTMVLCSASAQIIKTIAGQLNPSPVPALSVGMNPLNFVADGEGNIYFADPENEVIRKLSPAGILTNVAGNGTYGFSGDGGPALSAQFRKPYGIARDGAGNLFVSDDGNYRVRKITPGGIISTIAGNGTAGFSGDGGPAVNAQITATGIAADTVGNVFFSDSRSHRIRKVHTNGMITTVAGNGTNGFGGNGFNGDGGPALLASIPNPFGIALDNVGNFYITELGGGRIRKVTTDGIIRTIVGNGSYGYSGDGGPATLATINSQLGNVAVDAAGNVYIADYFNNRIRVISAATGIINTVAGTGTFGYSGDGGPALSAQIISPFSVSIDQAGNLYVPTNNCVRKITPNGTITTVAGNKTNAFSGDGGMAVYAQMRYPTDAVPDGSGNILIVDKGNSYIRKISSDGIITSIAGNIGAGFSGDGGPATAARLNSPSSVAKTSTGDIYIADAGNNRIRKIDVNGIITTIAGNGTRGYSGDRGPAISAMLNAPASLRVDAGGNIYFCEYNNHCVRKISTNGIINTIAGNGTSGFAGDGGQATAAQLSFPAGLAIDASGNVFITDAGNLKIRKISGDGTISTIAGNGTQGFSGDGGNALNASFKDPESLFADLAGNILLCDGGNNRIRKINTSGIVTTIAGGGSSTDDGIAATSAEIMRPTSVTQDAVGTLYISDWLNNRVRKVTMSALPLRLTEFKASVSIHDVVCTWKTSDEINTHNFSVQRSTDGTRFMTIGTVEAKGTGSALTSYDYIDYNAADQPVQMLYYRLEITDLDAKKIYSQVNIVKLPYQTSGFSLAPNPASESVVLKGESIKLFTITDYSGKLVQQQSATGNQTILNVSGLKKGMYTIQVMYFDGSTRSEKLMIR